MTKKKQNRSEDLPLGTSAKITELVDGESDRGAILILGAYLEELLGELIQNSCTSKAAADDLLDLRRPAGDFDSKISICAAFGLIHPTEATALHAVRKIRNGAAHFDKKGRGFDVLFDSDSTIDLVRNLLNALNLSLESREKEKAKNLFILATRLLATRILFRNTLARRPPTPPSMRDFANDARARLEGTAEGDRLAAIDSASKNGDFETIREHWKEIETSIKEKIDKYKAEGR